MRAIVNQQAAQSCRLSCALHRAVLKHEETARWWVRNSNQVSEGVCKKQVSDYISTHSLFILEDVTLMHFTGKKLNRVVQHL